MKIARLVWAIWMCSPLALQAGPAEALGHGSSSAAHAETQESARVGSGKGAVSRGGNTAAAVSPRRGAVTPQRGAGQVARSNADRLHSLLRTQARALAAKPLSRPAGSGRAAATASAIAPTPAFHGASPVRPTTAVSKIAARAPPSANPPSAKAVTRGSLIDGLRPAGPGRLGGSAIGRVAAANRAAVDGAQIRRRF
jgi:hypothetical protein